MPRSVIPNARRNRVAGFVQQDTDENQKQWSARTCLWSQLRGVFRPFLARAGKRIVAEEGSCLAVRADQAARLLGAARRAQQVAGDSQTEGSRHARATQHKIAGDGS